MKSDNEKKALSKKVENLLRTKIINGELKAEERIIENDIAKLMNVSRGPVRDALKVLGFEGLLTYESNKGCKVVNLSMEDAYEVFYLRGNLEIMALNKSGGKLSDISIFSMQNYLEEMKKAQEREDLLQMVKLDELFHKEIVNSGNLKRLVKMWESLSPLNGAMFLKVNSTLVLREGENEEDIFGEFKRQSNYEAHKILLEKIKKGNLEDIILKLKEHYLKVGEMIYKVESRRLYKEREI